MGWTAKNMKYMNMDDFLKYIWLETYRQQYLFRRNHQINFVGVNRDFVLKGNKAFDWKCNWGIERVVKQQKSQKLPKEWNEEYMKFGKNIRVGRFPVMSIDRICAAVWTTPDASIWHTGEMGLSVSSPTSVPECVWTSMKLFPSCEWLSLQTISAR